MQVMIYAVCFAPRRALLRDASADVTRAAVGERLQAPFLLLTSRVSLLPFSLRNSHSALKALGLCCVSVVRLFSRK